MKSRVRKDIQLLFNEEVACKKQSNQDVCQVVLRTIGKLSKKELISTMAFLKREKDFLHTLKDDKNPNFVVELESKRISEILFSDFKDNFFVRLVLSFEAAVTLRYEKDIRLAMSRTCLKFRSMSYKVVKFNI